MKYFSLHQRKLYAGSAFATTKQDIALWKPHGNTIMVTHRACFSTKLISPAYPVTIIVGEIVSYFSLYGVFLYYVFKILFLVSYAQDNKTNEQPEVSRKYLQKNLYTTI